MWVGSKAETHLSMHYHGGVRFPRASFLGYYETWLPPSQNSHTNWSLRRPSLQLLDNPGTPGPQILPPLDLFRPTARRHGGLERYTPTRQHALTCNPHPNNPYAHKALQCQPKFVTSERSRSDL